MTINGDLLECDAKIICHQVNLQGIFGGGLALQIRNKYQECEKEVQLFIEQNEELLGKVCVYIAKDVIIANCFSQDKDYNTDYEALKKCVDEISKYNGDTAIPFNYGCGIANGNWSKVKEIWEKKIPDIMIIKKEEIK